MAGDDKCMRICSTSELVKSSLRSRRVASSSHRLEPNALPSTASIKLTVLGGNDEENQSLSSMIRISLAIGNPSSAFTIAFMGPCFSASVKLRALCRCRIRLNLSATKGRDSRTHQWSGNSSIGCGGSATNVDKRFKNRCIPMRPANSMISSSLKPWSCNTLISSVVVSGFD